MKILDVFGYFPENELSIERIEEIIMSLENGALNQDGYYIEKTLPESANGNAVNCTKDLINEGRKVCYLMRDSKMVAVIGYK